MSTRSVAFPSRDSYSESVSGDSTASAASAASTRSAASTASSRRRNFHNRRDSEKAAAARVSRSPSLYIGPWQEFALGRALQQRPNRRAAGLRASPDAADRAADGADAFAVDLEFFRAFASQSDEEGIRNLLRCAPRFIPIMQSLGRASQTRTAPHSMPHTAAAAAPAEPPDVALAPRQRPWSATGPSRSAAAASVPAAAAAARRRKPAAAASVPAQRRLRMQQLQAMYRTAEGDESEGSKRGSGSGGGGGSGGSSGAIGPASGASERAPLPPLLPPLQLPPPSPSQRATLLPLPPCSPLRGGTSHGTSHGASSGANHGASHEASHGASSATAPLSAPSAQLTAQRPPASPTPLSAEWEEEVDALLEWTMGLADFE